MLQGKSSLIKALSQYQVKYKYQLIKIIERELREGLNKKGRGYYR